MNWDLFYKIANASVIPAWALLAIVPNHVITKKLVHSGFWTVAISVVYVFLFFYCLGGEGGMDTLQNLKISFQRDEVLLLGWVHYLAFDLFIGAWISRDARTIGLHHLVVLPMLFLTLFAGPVGLLVYLTTKATRQR
ncbi:MAG: hypothetical protein ACJAYA_000534 [Bacteroidia bacterium]|jgi:hypothetical protein